MEILGREEEQKILRDSILSTESSLIALSGRRRIGKTFLV